MHQLAYRVMFFAQSNDILFSESDLLALASAVRSCIASKIFQLTTHDHIILCLTDALMPALRCEKLTAAGLLVRLPGDLLCQDVVDVLGEHVWTRGISKGPCKP